MDDYPKPPILDHPLVEAAAFTPAALMEDVRRLRGVGAEPLPAICFLEFDGDLTDWLVDRGIAVACRSWACFHSAMFTMQLEGITCGIIARAIGGPYAVLIAEQLREAGVRAIIGLTSAGRLDPNVPVPGLIVVESAIRDEGTSYHYLPPACEVICPCDFTKAIAGELAGCGLPVRVGRVWTTDAPYRETQSQLQQWARSGALAVEMQAASLFAFGQARNATVAVVAVVSNAIDHSGDQFDTGGYEQGLRILRSLARSVPPATLAEDPKGGRL